MQFFPPTAIIDVDMKSVTIIATVLKQSDIFISGAGCIWNDILDREFDRQVGKYILDCAPRKETHRDSPERTKNRPIASGAISVPGALVFLFIHLAIMLRMIWNFDPIAYVEKIVFRVMTSSSSSLKIPIWRGIYRVVSRYLPPHEEDHLLATSMARSVVLHALIHRKCSSQFL
jgi:hypothetical protein